MTETRTIVLSAFDGVTLTDIVSPADVFVMTNTCRRPEAPPYAVIVSSVAGGLVRASSGLALDTRPLDQLAGLSIHTLMIAGGGPPEAPPVPSDLVAWLARNGGAARRICTVCTGSFLAAAAGLADGRRLTTHWESVAAMQAAYPEVVVEKDPIFVRDGALWSSAGFSAGVDLALALVEEDHGLPIALAVARKLIMFVKRSGGQPQFSSPLELQSAGDPTFARLHAWMADSLGADLSVEVLARQVNMTARTFARHYAERVGRTPGKTVEALRLDAACRALAEPGLSIKVVAQKSGFRNEQALRRAFNHNFGMSPDRYRDTAAA